MAFLAAMILFDNYEVNGILIDGDVLLMSKNLKKEFPSKKFPKVILPMLDSELFRIYRR